jgi:hypothetical protein
MKKLEIDNLLINYIKKLGHEKAIIKKVYHFLIN